MSDCQSTCAESCQCCDRARRAEAEVKRLVQDAEGMDKLYHEKCQQWTELRSEVHRLTGILNEILGQAKSMMDTADNLWLTACKVVDK